MDALKLGKGNAKLDKSIYTFSLPAGWSCPGAKDCKSKAVVIDGKACVVDGPSTVFRCFAASQEALYPSARLARRHNLDLLKGKSLGGMIDLLQAMIDNTGKDKGTIRLHASGDFFNRTYFLAWCAIARDNPNWVFYGYTKSIKYWSSHRHDVPSNMVLTASLGGKQEAYIKPWMRTAIVVFHPDMADELGLEIDHDDSLAMGKGGDFALLLHGVQPKGSFAAQAKVRLNQLGHKGYSR